MENGGKQGQTEVFLGLMMSNQDKIRSYIAVLVPNRDDADDIMQDTVTIMWRKFDEFRLGTDFAAWGVRIAYYRVLYYRRNKKGSAKQMSDGLFENLADRAVTKVNGSDDHLDALQKCIKKLDPSEKGLLKIRYESEKTTKGVAQRTGKSLTAVYRAFARIHDKLARCVRRTIAEEVTG